MSRFLAFNGVVWWAWAIVLVMFVVVSAIPPGIALYRRSSELRFVNAIVGIPMAFTFWYVLTLPVWMVAWVVALVIAIRSPGLESRRTTKRRSAELQRRIAQEARPPSAPPGAPSPAMGAIGLGVPRSAWGDGRPPRPAAVDEGRPHSPG